MEKWQKMIRQMFLLATMLVTWILHENTKAATWYVDGTKLTNGSGTSWSDPFNSLEHGLSIGKDSGDTVKVRGSTSGLFYKPPVARNKFFFVSPEVVLRGGYSGSGEDWNPDVYKTILSGEQGVAGTTDNNYHVIMMTSGSVVSGFTIENGVADGTGESCYGGGVVAYSSGALLDSCIVRNNTATIGGGLASLSTHLNVRGCRFENNTAVDSGGGIWHLGSYLTIRNSIFRQNRTQQFKGGAISGIVGTGDDYVVVSGCTFDTNSSNGEGGALYLVGDSLVIRECRFTGNSSAGLGGAVVFYGETSSFDNNHFSRNAASAYGGALYLRNARCRISASDIDSNRTDLGSGGGLYIECDSLFMSDVNFKGNYSGYLGGGLCFLGKRLGIDNAEFITNSADNGGAAHLFHDVGFGCDHVNCDFTSKMIIVDSRFEGNSAVNTGSQGGAINWLGKGDIKNSVFLRNTAISGNGGAINGWFNTIGDSIHFRSGNISRDTGYSFVVYDRWQQAEIDSSHTARIINCEFTENQAFNGSAVNNWNGELFGCWFNRNVVNEHGTVSGYSTTQPGNDILSVRNCTFTNNICTYWPSAGLVNCKGVIENSIFWNNGGTDIYDCTQLPAYCIIQDWNRGGTGNSKLDPLFLGGSFYPERLSPNSPAIDAGNPSFTSTDTSGLGYSDLTGTIRFRHNRIDIGAFESHHGRIYVDSRAIGNNSGSTWANAFKKIQDALQVATTGDSIWVARGTYYPTNDASHDSCFKLDSLNSVTLLGGFIGNETSISQRNVTSGLTVLSGDIGIRGSIYDNSHTVIWMTADTSLVIDGFEISSARSYGGIIGQKLIGTTQFKNCEFKNNYSWNSGSAVFIDSSDTISFVKCSFDDNRSSYYGSTIGGAISLLQLRCVNIENCTFFDNLGDEISTPVMANAIELQHCTNSFIINSTIHSHVASSSVAALYQNNGRLSIVNSILHNSGHRGKEIVLDSGALCTITNSLIRGGIDSIAVFNGSDLDETSSIYNFEPLFTDTTTGDLSLSLNSPCIDRGVAVDTTGWGSDIYGSPRIHNGIIDLGAAEFQGIPIPNPPVILSTLDNIEIPAGETLTLDLNRRSTGTNGFYVRYDFRDISELVWWPTSNDTAAHISLDPEMNMLTVTAGLSLRPGATFTVHMRAVDPLFTNVYSEKTVRFKVISPVFEICSISVIQKDTGRSFLGVIDVKRTINPIVLSGDRIYLGDTVNTTTDKMQYIKGISVTEVIPPLSRGGTVDCGRYEFVVNPASVYVYNANGISTGKTLVEWAVDSTSRWPGSLFYKKNRKIRFYLPVTNQINAVKYVTIDTPTDFDGPFTQLMVSENYTHRQRIVWDAFSEPLQKLSLFVFPQGLNPPPTDSVQFDSINLAATSYWMDSLEDAREYRYTLRAEDLKGNISEMHAAAVTPSGRYTIRGRLTGINVFPVDTQIRVSLYRFIDTATGSMQWVDDSLVVIDSSFSFHNLVNGRYRLSVAQGHHYFPQPSVLDTTILRDSILNLVISVTPKPLIAYDAMRVNQREGTGDLQFSVSTDTLFIDEVPTAMFLRWEGGEDTVLSDSQLIPIDPARLVSTPLSGGRAKWEITIARKTIEDSILLKDKKGFDVNVRYINSSLVTSAFGYSAFRSALWAYPITKESNSSEVVLFTAQRFVKPLLPLVTKPVLSQKDAVFFINPNSAGPRLEAQVKFQPLGMGTPVDSIFDVGDYSNSFYLSSGEWIVRRFDWNAAREYRTTDAGSGFLSGVIIDTGSSDSLMVRPSGGFISPTGWVPDVSQDSLPYATWRLEIPSAGTYWMWLYLEKPLLTDATVLVSFGKPTDDKKYRFLMKKGTVAGWQKVWLAGSAHPDFNNVLPVLQYGKIDVCLYMPTADCSISAIALRKKSTAKETWPVISSDLYNTIPLWGTRLNGVIARGFNLSPDMPYRLLVNLRDRYGNVSDTVVFDTIKTKDLYFSNRITLSEAPVTGNILIDLDLPDTSALLVDSLIFKFNGNFYPIALQQEVTSNPQRIELSRAQLASLLPIDEFKRHVVYDSIFIVLASDTSWTVRTPVHYTCNSCDECRAHFPGNTDTACSVKTESRLVPKIWPFVWQRKTTVTRTCRYTETDTIHDTIRTPRIPASWPSGAENQVASQEYRLPSAPIFTTVSKTARSITLACSTLNVINDSTVREQMAGSIIASWKPGAFCADSSIDTIEFGNRFTMQSNWISFMPSFEGAVSTNTGVRLTQDSLSARHQWIDRFTSGNPLSGGEFFPNIGISLTDADMLGNRSRVPSISTAIWLDSLQASQDTVSDAEKFHLWVMPSKINGTTSRYFYWGVDTVPILSDTGDVYNIDTTTWAWVQGPDIYLTPGKHTIDLFMKDDGVGIAGIALSKEDAYPTISRTQLSRWGTAGFDCTFEARELPSNTPIKFTFEAVDRFGNRSIAVHDTETTTTLDIKVPRIVISPSLPLEKGYYHSILPAFSLSTDKPSSDSLSIETYLLWNHAGSTDTMPGLLVSLVDTVGHVWSAEMDTLSPLTPFPDTGAVTSANGYALLARAVSSHGVPGDWSRLVFGIVPDTNEVPPSVTILDSIYEVSALAFRFDHGVETISRNVIIGDLEIIFDSTVNTAGTKLMLEGATIYTDTLIDGMGDVIHESITGISGGTIVCYTCSDYYSECSRSPTFKIEFGKHFVEIPDDSISLVTSPIARLVAGGAEILDDNGSRVRLSGTPSPGAPVRISYFGMVDTCYASQDRFFLHNVLTFGNSAEGFSLNACRMVFAPDTVAKTCNLFAAGACDSCGPDLVFTVVSPRYLDAEFSVFDGLTDPIRLSYSTLDPKYRINFGGVANTVTSSNSADVSYRDWKLSLKSYNFDSTGVHLTDFSVGIPQETFPADKNAGRTHVDHFAGVRITGDTAINSGALHFFGSAKASASAVTLTTVNNYSFGSIDTLRFQEESGVEYSLRPADPCSLVTPSGNTEIHPTSFNEKDNITLPVASDTGFIIDAGGIRQVFAAGDFKRSIGMISTGETFTIQGNLHITYAANDFQLLVLPNGVDSLFMLDQGFFTDETENVHISKASIGLFSDFTINTLYGKKEGKTYYVKANNGLNLGIPSEGFDIFKTDGDGPAGIRVLLLAPTLPLGNLSDLIPKSDGDCDFTPAIYNAGYDLDGNLTNISGRIDMPDDMLACFGVKGLGTISEQVAEFKLKTLYLGYEEEVEGGRTFSVGADATITLGKLFNPIGLMGERITLDKVIAKYNSNGKWALDEMHASAFQMPRLIGIGPKNFSSDNTSIKSAANYIELYTGGKGFSLDYVNESLKLQLKNWALRTTDSFPVVKLRNVSFLIDSLNYVKPDGVDGKITQLRAAGVYVPPDGRLSFGDVHLCGVKVRVACDSLEEDTANRTKVNAYFGLSVDTLRVGEKVFQLTNGGEECKTDFRIYFDGRVSGSGCLVWKKRIGIVPWGDTTNPDLFIDTVPGGSFVSFTFDSDKGVNLTLKNARLKTRPDFKVPVLDTIVDVAVDELAFKWDSRKKTFALTALDVDWYIYKKIMENDAFKVAIKSVEFGYKEEGREFSIMAEPDFSFKLNDKCEMTELSVKLGMINKVDDDDETQRKMNFVFKVNGDFKCSVAGFDFGAQFKLNGDTIGFPVAYLKMDKLLEYGLIKNDSTSDGYKAEINNESPVSFRPQNFTAGVKCVNVYWVKQADKKTWKFNPDKDIEGKEFKAIPTFSWQQPFEICGFGLTGTVNFERLFDSPHPGIGYNDISLLYKKATIPTMMSLFIDNRKPYIHPSYDKPSVFTIKIPSIQLTESFKLGEAMLQFGTEVSPDFGYETWFARGKASMSLSPAIDNLTVDLSFEKPHPWENVTGIRHAKVKLKLDEACRIPLGSTPFYIAGFEGALYDGSGMPEAALACYIPTLPPGLKVEAAMLLEFEEPSVVNGKIAFWVHLRRFNLGINGEVVALEGIAEAKACAAIYNNGQAFHGHFLTYVHLGLAAKGQFTVDMWRDTTGGNFTTEALAAIGLSKGSLINTKLIKIPTKEKWFVDMFTRAGKFEGNRKGITTGINFFGKNWGVGVINKKFKVGDVAKLKLKQAPIVIPPLAAPARLGKRMSGPSTVMETPVANVSRAINPGFVLEGGEVISFIAASDSGRYEWPDNVLMVANAATRIQDLDTSHYMAFEGRGTDTTEAKFYHEYNVVGRVWANEDSLDSILVYVPEEVTHPNGSRGSFEYLFSAGLKPASIHLTALADTTSTQQKVVFNGTVTDFQGHLRTMLCKKEAGGYDTLFHRKMDLQLITSSIGSRPADTVYAENYLYNYIPIPISQFVGYTEGDSSLLNNDNVSYDSTTRTVTLNNLVWKCDNAAPGIFAICAAIENTDFVIETDTGKVIVPLDKPDEASSYRTDPVVLPSSASANDTVVVTVRATAPITRPTGFTATGSAAASNWANADERRSIFLRWNMDNNQALSGYEVSWKPRGDTDDRFRHSAIVGKTDHYTIEIPDIAPVFTSDCDSAEGAVTVIWDTTITSDTIWVDGVASDAGAKLIDSRCRRPVVEYDTTLEKIGEIPVRHYRLCPETAPGYEYFFKDTFDVTITPIVTTIATKQEDDYRSTGKTKAVEYLVNEKKNDSAVTITNVVLGVNRGAASNNLAITFKPDSPYVDGSGNYNGTPIAVPINTGKTIPAEIAVSDSSFSVDPSRYGELWATITPVDTGVDIKEMPRAGTFSNYFTVKTGNNPLRTALSIRPLEKTQTCKELFGNSCRKVNVALSDKVEDSTRYESCTTCVKSAADSCSDCDPGFKDNKLTRNDPCNGHPDSIMYGRTPFGLYTARLFAVNNGRRGTPVFDATAGPVVYDSIRFCITPPEPVLHEVKPGYVLFERFDTISLAVSNLWLDSSAALRPALKLTWDSLGIPKQMEYALTADNILPMLTSEGSLNWKRESPADWEVRYPTNTFYIPGTGEVRFNVSIVNRDLDATGDTVTTESNSMSVAFVNNPDDIECPGVYYDPDNPNAEYLMDWIGNFPRYPSAGDTMQVRFTELHDFDTSHYSVKVVHKVAGSWSDSTPINDFKVERWGLWFKLPVSITPSTSASYKIVTNLDTGYVLKCITKNWGQHDTFPLLQPRTYTIQPEPNGFRIVCNKEGKPWQGLDLVRYYIGSNTGGNELSPVGYNHTADPAQLVTMSQSNLVTAIITDENGDNRDTLQKWIDIAIQPELVYPDGTPVPDTFVAEAGDTLYIRSPMPAFADPTSAKPYHCFTFANSQTVCNSDMVIFTAASRSKLTIERHVATRPGQTIGYINAVEGARDYVFTLKTYLPDQMAAITIPSQRLLDAAAQRVYHYPLLLRLDTSIVDNLAPRLRQPFHFRNAALLPIPFEVESIDTIANTATIWVQLDTLDPGIANSTVYMVTGSRVNDSRAVWRSAYTAVWHCTADTAITDATGYGNTLPFGAVTTTSGVVKTALSLTGSQATGPSRNSTLGSSENGFSISAWVWLDSIADAPAPVASFSNSSGRMVAQLLVAPDTSLSLIVGLDTITTLRGALEEGTWLNVAATCTQEGTAMLYINGLPIASSKYLNNPRSWDNWNGSVRIGSSAFFGKIDELRVANAPLSDDFITLDWATQRQRNDFLRIPQGVTSVTALSNPEFRLIPGAKAGDQLASDNPEYRISVLPPDLAGQTLLRMPWSERESRADTLCTVTLNGPATIHVLFDADAAPAPFLSPFTQSGRSVFVAGPLGETDSMDIYTRHTDSATTLLLGGPASGGDGGNRLPYAVVLDCIQQPSFKVAASSAPFVRMSKADNGELLYADREYTIDSLPAQLAGGVLVRTPEAWRFKSDVATVAALSVNRPATVNLLLDTAYTSWPDFVLGDTLWKPTGMRVKSSRGCFTVMSRTLQPDSIIASTGARTGGAGGNRTGYAFIVQPVGSGIDTTIALDTGAVPYTDSLWHIKKLVIDRRDLQLRRTRQTDYASAEPNVFSLILTRSTNVYCAIDHNQEFLPTFMNVVPNDPYKWVRTRFSVETSVGGKYVVWQRFFKDAGTYSLSGARTGGDTSNAFNYFLFVEPSDTPGTITPIDTFQTARLIKGLTPWENELPQTTVDWFNAELDSTTILITDALSSSCGSLRFMVDKPVRVWLGVDPAYRTEGSFLDTARWIKTTNIIALSGTLADRIVWYKEFNPGIIEIPNAQCGYEQPGVFNPMVIIEFLEAPVAGLTARNLAVRGFGDDRSTESANFKMRNLDVVYSWDIGLRSRSWIMDVATRSAVADRGDTVCVLIPKATDFVLSMGDTTVVRGSNRFYLADLMPVLVAADSVVVNAIDLSASGSVRVAFRNNSTVAVNNEFVVLLFEDRNHDYQWTRGTDRRLGSVTVHGIAPSEYKIYHIGLSDSLAFPKQALFAFIDANNYVAEMDEWNNEASGGGGCEGYAAAQFVADSGARGYDSARVRVPVSADTVIYCYLEDSNGDSLIDRDDSLYALFTYNNKLYAVNSAGDSLFTPQPVNALGSMHLRLDDITGDNIPEITVDNALFTPTGTLLWDTSSCNALSCPRTLAFDFNLDGDADSSAWDELDSCITIRSGRDSALLYAYPLSRYNGVVDPVTEGVLADIGSGVRRYYDANVSFPRYSSVNGDTVDLTIRVANTGAAAMSRGVVVTVYADTSAVYDSTRVRAYEGTIKVAETLINELKSQEYRDVRSTATLPVGTKRVWFVVNGDRRYFECSEKDNVLMLGM